MDKNKGEENTEIQFSKLTTMENGNKEWGTAKVITSTKEISSKAFSKITSNKVLELNYSKMGIVI